jgi:hypothetical protein
MHPPPLSLLRRTLVGITLGLAFSATAQAHSVRIEPTAEQNLVIVFGDHQEAAETSPGRLDLLTTPIAWVGSGDTVAPLRVRTEHRHFRLLDATADQVAVAETRFPAFVRGARPASWPQFYQRWHPAGSIAPSAPALTFDIVPTKQPGQFRVYFRGAALARASVRVDHLGTGTRHDLLSDADGYITYSTADPGLVLMTSNRKEDLAGFTRGQPYSVTSHNITLTWIQPSPTSDS